VNLETSLKIAAAGMHAQSARVRITSENLANAQSTAQTPGADPYRRKTISFANVLDRATGAELVEVSRYGVDRAPFERRFEPSHPAADAEGYVEYPNVSPLVELMDMREAQRSFEANAAARQQASGMLQRTLDLLR
jgi:flagellar basal-body rod protein FlgC